MRIILPLVISVTLAIFPLSAIAWQHNLQRGVDLYQTQDANVSVSLICDPNSVYGTTVSAVLVGIDAETELNIAATFRFPDLVTVQVTLDHGRISKSANESGAWEPLLSGFRSHSAVEISVGGVSQTINLGEPMPFSCT